ncbi:MAG: SpoIIE family protein phosphatase [Bacteroidota bacterium]|nr:SpoIIE family protein phosphatase [Bacteroidota bacterium]
MKPFFKILTAFLLLFSSAFSLFSQAYQFKNYSVDNGITQPYVYTINQDKNGYLLIGTGEGLCKFDGINFKSFYTKDGVAENFVTSSYRDNARNLWLGHSQGSVTFYDGKVFKVINTSGFSKSPVTCIIGDDKGSVWCSTQNDGIFRINKNFEVDVFKIEFNQENIFSINFTRSGQLLAGTGNGIMVYNLVGEKRKPVFVSLVESIPETKIQCIIKKNNSGSFWIGTEDEGLFLLTPAKNKAELFKAESIGKKVNFDIVNVQDVYEDALSNLWIATFGDGVIKLSLSLNTLQYGEAQRFSEDNGLGNKYTKSIYADHEGNIWVGTYGSGLVHLTDNCFTFYYHTPNEYSNNVTSILITPEIKWFGVEDGLIKIEPEAKQKWIFYGKKSNFLEDKITALYQKDSSHLLIGTEKNGAYELDIPTSKFRKLNLPNDQLSSAVNCITGNEMGCWIATRNGLFQFNTENEVSAHYTTENGLTHNNINQIRLDPKGTLWIATHSNFLSTIKKDAEIVENKQIYFGTDLINITGFFTDKKDNIWMTTFGNGVLCLDQKKDTVYTLSAENGLKSNYCYGIIDDGSGNLWIGHRMGLSRIRTEKNSIDIFGREDGITGDCNYNSFIKDANGDAWFGTTNGAIKYDPHKDKKNLTPPIVNITSFKMNDKDVDFSKEISMPSDDYKLRIDFIGISFKANTKIRYQYKLEGYDVDWSDKTMIDFAQYGKLSEGEYTFLLKAFNNDGISNETPLSIRISIDPPFWKRAWFILLTTVLSFYAIYLFVKMRERNHRRFQIELQKALNEKTREVIFQKEEIEKKNTDITDSIRYAKRIQDAIMPDLNLLRQIFPESFVFFQPRDIVSGDFYWFEKYGNKLIVVCADATGHGVPGAFMSMIGSTLLKDITSRQEVTSPAHALSKLDSEIKTLLKQNDDDFEHTYDNVDVVICEINLDTLLVRTCTTRRSFFVSSDQTLKMIKKDVTDIQEYETRDIQMKKGDMIYLFTDGYPDQFGGEKGKKIKTSNMRIMLEQIHTLPFADQAVAVDRYFNRWKEGYEQVDDVLFIGIQL